MDTQISDYEALTETREIKSLTSCPRLTTHLMSVMESEFFSMWFSSWRSSQSRMPSFSSWHRMPTDDSTASVWSWHLQEPSGPDVVHASSRPFTLCQQFLSRHDAGYHGFLLHHQSLCHPITECSSPLNCQLAIQVGDPKQRPLACPRSVTSASLARGVQL